MEVCIHTHTHTQLIHFVVQQKLSQHCKAIILQLKKKKKPLFETLRTLRSRTSLYSPLSHKAPSYIEKSQEMLLYKYFFLSKRNNLLDSTAQTIFWFLPLCFMCCREHSGNWTVACCPEFLDHRNQKRYILHCLHWRKEEEKIFFLRKKGSQLCSFSNKRHRTELARRSQKDWRSAEFHVGPWELHVIYISSLLDKTLLAGKHVKSKWQFKVKGYFFLDP